MKLDFRIFPDWEFLPRRLLVGIAVFAITSAESFAETISASFASGSEVAVRSEGFTANDKSVQVALNFAPASGQDLTLVRNTGSGFIRGKFKNLAQGQIVTLRYGGIAYHFVANYYGGSGRDLVLTRISLDDLSPAAREKLDNQLVLALKKSRRETPFDRATSLRPEDYEKGGRVLVDIEASVSSELTKQIAQLGGEVINGWETAGSLRAWIPLARLEALANLPGIQSISAARPSITRHIER